MHFIIFSFIFIFSLSCIPLFAVDLPIEVVETKTLSKPPSNWQIQGKWGVKPVLSCKTSPEKDSYLRRGVVGDGFILAEINPVEEVPGMLFGLVLSVPGSSIKLERRKTPEGAFVFMALKQANKDLGEKKVPAPEGKTVLLLERKGNGFNGWIVGADGEYQLVGGVTWPDLDSLMIVGIFVKSTSEGNIVKVDSLKVGGVRHDPSRMKFLFDKKGEHTGNVKDSKAEIIDSTGRYTGGFKDGRKNGQGVMVYASGTKYEGEFKDGRPSAGWCTKKDGKRRQCYMDESKKWIFTEK